MPKAKHESHVMEFAKRGAEARLRDLIQEMKLLVELFPHLRDSFDRDELPIAFLLRTGAARAFRNKRVPRRPRTAAPRKAAG